MSGRDPQRGRGRSASGYATLLALAWAGFLSIVAAVGLSLGFAAAGQHRVDAAADLVALSAAGHRHGPDPCQLAASVADANGVLLSDCSTAGEDVLIRVRDELALPFGIHLWIDGRARAGPG